MQSRMSHRWMIAVAVTLMAGAVLPVAAGAAEPSAGSAQVDGAVGEWSAADEQGPLVSITPPHEDRAVLSLRYDCGSRTLFARVQALPGALLQTTDPVEAYLRVGPTGKLVSGTDEDGRFAWVGREGDAAAGFEMSAQLAPGDRSAALRVHAKVPDDSADGYETVDLARRYEDLTIVCPDPAGRAAVADGVSDPPASAAGASLVRTGLVDGGLLLAVAGVLILGGIAALRVRRRLTGA